MPARCGSKIGDHDFEEGPKLKSSWGLYSCLRCQEIAYVSEEQGRLRLRLFDDGLAPVASWNDAGRVLSSLTREAVALGMLRPLSWRVRLAGSLSMPHKVFAGWVRGFGMSTVRSEDGMFPDLMVIGESWEETVGRVEFLRYTEAGVPLVDEEAFVRLLIRGVDVL